MEHSPHVFLSREGADEFSREQGLEQAPSNYFRVEERYRQLEELLSRPADEQLLFFVIFAKISSRTMAAMAVLNTSAPISRV